LKGHSIINVDQLFDKIILEFTRLVGNLFLDRILDVWDVLEILSNLDLPDLLLVLPLGHLGKAVDIKDNRNHSITSHDGVVGCKETT